MNHITKQHARKQLLLPEQQCIITMPMRFQPESISTLTPLLFSLSALKTLHDTNFCLYLLSKGNVDTLSATQVAQQAQTLDVAHHLFFNLNPTSSDYQAVEHATDIGLLDNQASRVWETTSKGRSLLEGLENIAIKNIEKKWLSKKLLKKLLTLALSECAHKAFMRLKQDPVTFYYTLFWAVHQKLLTNKAATDYFYQTTPYIRKIMACYTKGKALRHVLTQKETSPNYPIHYPIHYPNLLHQPFIEPFADYLAHQLTSHLHNLTDKTKIPVLLLQLIQPLVTKMDAYFLQALAIWQRDNVQDALTHPLALHQLTEKGGLTQILHNYPNWARLVWHDVFAQYHALINLLKRLRTDLLLLSTTFFANKWPILLKQLQCLSENLFYGPIKLTFNHGKSLLYKPRNLQVDMYATGCSTTSYTLPFPSLAERFNRWNDQRIIHPLTFICQTDQGGDYGYVEYVKADSAPSQKQQAFLLGHLSTFALLCGLADLHSDNLCYYRGQLALIDCKYVFSPVVFERLSSEINQPASIWDESSLAATHMESLWQALPGHTLQLTSVELTPNEHFHFKSKQACVIALPATPCFTFTEEVLSMVEQGFKESWQQVSCHKYSLHEWFAHCKALTTYSLPLSPSKSALHQHTLKTHDVFYCHDKNQLIEEISQRITAIVQQMPTTIDINPRKLALQWLQSKPPASDHHPDTKAWQHLFNQCFYKDLHHQLWTNYKAELSTRLNKKK